VPWPPAESAASDASGRGGKPGGLVAKASGTAGELATASEVPAVELPPWEPARPVGGQLRNIFTRVEGTRL
jgi:hypothetical protein